MMLASLLLPLVVAPQENGSAMISKMIAYYNKATTVSGTVAMKQHYARSGEAFEEKVEALTTIHFDRLTRKAYLDQQFATKNTQWRMLLTADGEVFSYDNPLSTINKNPAGRVVEAMMLNGKPLNEKDVYHVVSGMLKDRSPVFDIAFSDKQDLSGIRSAIFNVKGTRKESLQGKEVAVVSGGWTDIVGSKAPTALYEFWIAGEGDLVRFVQAHEVQVMKNPNDPPVNITVVYDVNLKVNSKIDVKIFKVVL